MTTYHRHRAAQIGSELHEFAKRCIELGVKLPRNSKTLNAYVNDALGFKMKPEVVLFYSYNAFGTADAISFNGKMLRIHDLKTGTTKVSMNQLYIYAALFCLEYGVKPGEIDMEFRIYQNDTIIVEEGDASFVAHIMDKIITFDNYIESARKEED